MHKTKTEKSDINANKSNEDLDTQIEESLLTFDERKKIAEIRYAALITEKKYSSSNSKRDSVFFKT